MPERPDLEYVVARLDAELAGATVSDLLVRKPVVLRAAVEGNAAELCAGRRFTGIARVGHFVRFDLVADAKDKRPLEVVVSPMLAGVFDLVPSKQRMTADVAVAWTLEDGRQLRYRDRKQMGKVYLIAAGEWDRVPGLQASEQGLDVLDSMVFTLEEFCGLAKKRRDQVRVFLMDKAALDSIGNAYADEVLWHARIHPKAWVRKLSDEELERLHASIGEVLGAAVQTIAERRPPLADKVRDFLSVRGRAGEPCARCGTKLRKAGVRGYDAHFCPECQPDHRGTGIVDWRKVP